MHKDSIVLLSKDAMCKAYLPQYGNEYWKGKTPNIDELANKGIIYNRFYTAAPSSAMSYISMFTGKYPYEHGLSDYVVLEKPLPERNLFEKANDEGFETHIIWDKVWMTTAYLHSLCYGNQTKIHPVEEFRQGVGPHYKHDGFLQEDLSKTLIVLKKLRKEIEEITKTDKKVFLWLHVPHVINGYVCYGTDIHAFDEIAGLLREFFDDSNIFISADHGNMNGMKGKLGYGFDVNEPAINIPLISPKKNNSVDANTLLCNVDLYQILFEKEIPKREYLFSETQYYAQNNRVLGIVFGKYKYIYYHKNNVEELFDLEFDPGEKFNLMLDYIDDIDRNIKMPSREEYFYPHWKDLPDVRKRVVELKDSIWVNPTKKHMLINAVKDITRPIRIRLQRKNI